MPALFDPIALGGQPLPNRLVVSPMCQFAAHEGVAGPWHDQHLAGLSHSGAGLMILESTAVSSEGRITPACLGLYSDVQGEALAGILSRIKAFSDIVPGVQLAHAGRKGSMDLPWKGDRPLAISEGGWQTCAPSSVSWGARPVPKAMDECAMAQVIEDYVQAARRAIAVGFRVIELHAAHGYLLHQFLTPLSNHRADRYGGTTENRMRFPRNVFEAVRRAVPAECALGVRLSGSDWHPEGLTAEDAATFAQTLQGADYFVVSSGGAAPDARVKVSKFYQIPMAEVVKAAVSVPVMGVGMISEPAEANGLIAAGRVDMVALGRAFLANPRWGWRAAAELGVTMEYPYRYQAVDPRYWRLAPQALQGAES
ncbi:NADH:flavin oxidoreductase/NADH oxidase [Celeribacter sp.]|uniref:NADH:flavin oxidoreductase/NADH oxidase n=1 Tax=Celeribacter sp. TaxID=1890673 RepID=UPI003A91DBEF